MVMPPQFLNPIKKENILKHNGSKSRFSKTNQGIEVNLRKMHQTKVRD